MDHRSENSMSDDEEDGKKFWDTFERKQRQLEKEVPDEEEWGLTEDRLALLRSLIHGDWVEGAKHDSAPWTFVCCHKAGWLERDRIGKVTMYRLAPEGSALLKNP